MLIGAQGLLCIRPLNLWVVGSRVERPRARQGSSCRAPPEHAHWGSRVGQRLSMGLVWHIVGHWAAPVRAQQRQRLGFLCLPGPSATPASESGLNSPRPGAHPAMLAWLAGRLRWGASVRAASSGRQVWCAPGSDPRCLGCASRDAHPEQQQQAARRGVGTPPPRCWPAPTRSR